MEHDHDCQGAPWRLDLEHERLWRGTEILHLRPKSFAVLRYLVAHPERLLSKDELVQAVWPNTAVSDGVLTVCMAELRKALGDTTQTPQYIETVPRRGYRWIGPLPTPMLSPSAAAASPPVALAAPSLAVGREAEGAQLHGWLAQARRGVRQVGFVTGEAGLGKTTLVDAFVAQVVDDPDLWLARGQCIEHYGAGEAYLPVLDALGQLGRGPGGERLVAALTQHAPTWLVQMPGLLSAAALEAVQRRVLGATRERMLRELAEALEALTAKQPLVLVLEDLHWSDTATLDLVGYLARRRVPARLLVLGTYRPVEVIVREHPLHALRLDLTLHRQCTELPLQLLTAADVAHYLAVRFGERACPAALAQALHRRTDGHPLFLVTVVDTLVRQGLLQGVAGQWQVAGALKAVEGIMPEGLLQMIAQQFAALSAETQGVLEAASVAGMASPVAAVAAGVEAAEEAVEAACASLAQRGQFLQAHGVEVWPDGTLTARYGFRHILYQQVVYDRMPVMRRLRLHRQIGARLEVGYGAQTGERAAELAMHFDRGRLYARAVPYWRQAAEQALRRWAYPEAIGYLQHCLEGLQTLPDTRERAQQELEVQLALGQACSATRGPAAVAVEQAFTRAEELCRQVGEGPQRVAVLRGLRELYLGRGELAAAQALAEQSLSLAQQASDPVLLLEAHVMLGLCAFYAGDAAMVCTHVDWGLALDAPPRHPTHMLPSRRDLRITGLGHAAVALWVLGYPEQAMERIHAALERAQDLSHPWSTTLALLYAGIISLLCGDGQAVQRQAAMLIRLATEQELTLLIGQGLILQGWAVAVQGQAAEGLAQMQQGKTILQDAEQQQTQPFFLALLAGQYGQAGQTKEGLHVLLEALTISHTRGLRMWEAELHRLRGVLLHQATAPGSAPTAAPEAEAESCMRQALDLARRQGRKRSSCGQR
jgi:DNA-binding winged helix-turn-helix (wHTH) protein/predicted ATPase